ncbi:MAG: sugar phosphate isomerase/epimerase [Angelakisella sp.]
MKLGVMTVCLGDMSLDATLGYLKGLGVQQVEIGCGGSPGTAHCDARKFIANPGLADEFMATIQKHGLGVAALSTHGNPVHPNKAIAADDHEQYEAAVQLAEKLHIPTVVTFSGCPGDCEESKYPNWAVATWPTDHQVIRDWQWNEKLIPYWKKAGKYAEDHNVKVALEIHPGFCVYNTPTMIRLREAVGPVIGANFDPSHLFWQGIDPVAAIRELGGEAIHHFHAKDTCIDKYNTAINGVLDTRSFSDIQNRPWVFRTVGYGHGEEVWRAIFSELRKVGYDGIISIEHEDGLMTMKEGLEKAIAFLQKNIIFESDNVNMFWA